jgi:protein transport protein SEC24
MIWLGHAVNPQILDDLLAVDNAEDVDVRMVSCRGTDFIDAQSSLPKLPTLLSSQVRNILSHFERVFGNSLSVSIVRQNVDGLEIEFANLLVEDTNNGALGYPECKLDSWVSLTSVLMQSHQQVAKELSGSGGGGPKDSWRPW